MEGRAVALQSTEFHSLYHFPTNSLPRTIKVYRILVLYPPLNFLCIFLDRSEIQSELLSSVELDARASRPVNSARSTQNRLLCSTKKS